MINLTNHCKDRYTERIKGITDYNEMKQYIAQNEDTITGHIQKLYEYSTFLFRGQIGGDKNTKVFRINGDIILVLDSGETCFITLYKIDFGFPDRTNKTVVKDLVEELDQINHTLDAQNATYTQFREAKQHEIDMIQAEIKNMHEQVDLLEAKKKTKQAEIDARVIEIDILRKQAEHYATMLCNSLEFKRDIKDGK